MQGVAVIPDTIVNGRVPSPAKVVEEGALGRADDVLLPEPIDELLLALLGTDEEGDLGSGALREHLAELTELEEGDGRVAREVLLGLRGERHEPGIVVRQEGEVRGGRDIHGKRERAPDGLSGEYMNEAVRPDACEHRPGEPPRYTIWPRMWLLERRPLRILVPLRTTVAAPRQASSRRSPPLGAATGAELRSRARHDPVPTPSRPRPPTLFDDRK